MHHLTPAHEALARLRPDLPVLTHLHGTELLMLEEIDAGAAWPHGGAWAERMRGWAARSARVLVGSEPGRDEAVAVLGLDRDAVNVVPNGVDLRVFDGRRAGPAERAAFWARHLCRRAARVVGRRPAAGIDRLLARADRPARRPGRAGRAVRRPLHRGSSAIPALDPGPRARPRGPGPPAAAGAVGRGARRVGGRAPCRRGRGVALGRRGVPGRLARPRGPGGRAGVCRRPRRPLGHGALRPGLRRGHGHARAADRHRRRSAAHLHRRRPRRPRRARAGSCRAATTRRWRRPWPTPRPTRPSAPCAAATGAGSPRAASAGATSPRRVVGDLRGAAVPVG